MNVVLLVAAASTLAALAAVGWVVIAVLRQNGRLLLRLEALESRLDNLGTSQNGASPRKPAPNFHLPDLTGAFFGLSDLRGHDTLLLFWDPNDEQCREMLDELKVWERRPPDGAPKLVVISVGGAEANTALDLCSLVLLDEWSELRRAFGIILMPSAVLVDAQNWIASNVAVGHDAVVELALAGYEATVPAR
jgi:hypothetical protein